MTSSFTEPSSDLSTSDRLTQIVTDASSAETVWTNEARTADDLLASLQPPDRSGIEINDQ